METSSPKKPIHVLSYKERMEREPRIQAEKKRMLEEQEQGLKPSNLTKEQSRFRKIIRQRDYRYRVNMNKEASDENYRRKKEAQRQRIKRLEIASQLPIKTPPKLISNEDVLRLQEIWKQQSQEEIQKMRQEEEEGVMRLSLTEDQRQIRKRIRQSARVRARCSHRREVSIETRLLRRDKRYMNEEERQIRDKLEKRIQEEKKRRREEQTLWSNLTEEQTNNQNHGAYMRRERQSGENSLESMTIGFILNEQ